MLRSRGDAVSAQVWAQDFGDHHRTVRLLIVLDDRDPGAAHGQPGTVQSMNVFAFATLGLESNARPPRLKRLAVGTRRYFHELTGGRQPHLEVVSLGRGKAHVTGAELQHAIMQA